MKKFIGIMLVVVAVFTMGLLAQEALGLMAKSPIDLDDVDQEDIDREVLRVGMIAELDAINLYEQLAAKAQNPNVKKVLLDIAREEKTHIGEFEALLLMLDKEQVTESAKGAKEIKELME